MQRDEAKQAALKARAVTIYRARGWDSKPQGALRENLGAGIGSGVCPDCHQKTFGTLDTDGKLACFNCGKRIEPGDSMQQSRGAVTVARPRSFAEIARNYYGATEREADVIATSPRGGSR